MSLPRLFSSFPYKSYFVNQISSPGVMGLEFLQRNTPPFLSFRNFIATQLSWEPASCSQESLWSRAKATAPKSVGAGDASL